MLNYLLIMILIILLFYSCSPPCPCPKITLPEHDSDPDGDGIPVFQRVSHVALFQAGNYDFYAVNCHLNTKLEEVSSEGHAAEYDALVVWLQDLANEQEKDAIVLGDFNRFYPK
jgi:endonuclease/exonuclease/phosphatase family metal-dependent hydrolase